MFTKNSRNRYDKKDSLELGQNAEDQFARLAVRYGWKVNAASGRGNVDEHYDYVMQKGEKIFKVDVKSLKRVARADVATQDEYLWIELHGVREKDEGWLYEGRADLIAFELTTSFRIVDRLELIDLVESLVDFDSEVHSAKDARYKVYSRADRPDLLTMIRADDLLQIRHAEWLK